MALTGTLLAKQFTGAVLRTFRPTLTLGLASGGVEKTLHASRVKLAHDPRNIILKLDYSYHREVLLRHLVKRKGDDEGVLPLSSSRDTPRTSR